MKLDQPPYETMSCINAAIAQGMELCPQPELVSWGRRWISPHAPAACAGGGPRPVTSRISRSSRASAFRSAVAGATSLSRCAVSRRVASPWHSSTIAPHLGVDQLGGRLAVGLALEGGREPVVLRGHEADRAELRAHSPAQYHLAGDLGDLPEVVLAARRDDAVDELLGRAPAERADDARPEIVLGVVGAVVGRELVGRPERHAPRDDAHARDEGASSAGQ